MKIFNENLQFFCFLLGPHSGCIDFGGKLPSRLEGLSRWSFGASAATHTHSQCQSHCQHCHNHNCTHTLVKPHRKEVTNLANCICII